MSQCNNETCKEYKKALREIVNIIDNVDNRCLAMDGPVASTLQEMRMEEMQRIYELASISMPN